MLQSVAMIQFIFINFQQIVTEIRASIDFKPLPATPSKSSKKDKMKKRWEKYFLSSKNLLAEMSSS